MTPLFIDLKNAQAFRGQRCVFNDLSLSLPVGQHVAILGPNGAGKTTLLKLMVRELYPVVRKGSHLRLFGHENIQLSQLRQKVGLVSHEFQNRYETLATGLDVVLSAFFGSIGLYQHQQVLPQHRDKAEQALHTFGLESLRDQQYLQLSAGQQRRLLLARATVHEPEVVILDEPTNNLDVASAFPMLAAMEQLAASGCTLVLVTHHIQEIIPAIDRILLLKAGEMVYDGEKSAAMTSEQLSHLFDYPLQENEHGGHYNWSPAAQ